MSAASHKDNPITGGRPDSLRQLFTATGMLLLLVAFSLPASPETLTGAGQDKLIGEWTYDGSVYDRSWQYDSSSKVPWTDYGVTREPSNSVEDVQTPQATGWATWVGGCVGLLLVGTLFFGWWYRLLHDPWLLLGALIAGHEGVRHFTDERDDFRMTFLAAQARQDWTQLRRIRREHRRKCIEVLCACVCAQLSSAVHWLISPFSRTSQGD